jgi:hypothetical protein
MLDHFAVSTLSIMTLRTERTKLQRNLLLCGVYMLSIVMSIDDVLSVVMLTLIMLSVVMLSVLAPKFFFYVTDGADG